MPAAEPRKNVRRFIAREPNTGRGLSPTTAGECSYTIFTFEIPLSRLVELASLPFIVTMEGGGHYSPESTAETKNE